MENTNKYYLQFKNYILSNNQLLKILKSENYDNNWDDKIFYAISRKTICEWKKLIKFKELCSEINITKVDSEKEKIINFIQKISSLNFSISSLKFDPLSNSLLNSKDRIDQTFEFSEFELISKDAWDLFVEEENHKNDGKILIKRGKNKIIIKFSNKNFNIFYLKENKNNKDILPNELDEYLNELVIEIINNQDIEPLINEIISDNINSFFHKIKYNQNQLEKVKCKYNNFKLVITQKNYINDKSIGGNSSIHSIKTTKIINSNVKKLIKNLNYINKNMVIKISNATSVISSMFSLSQIPEFVDYFYLDNNTFENPSEILTLFKNYLNSLLTESNEKQLSPIEFMQSLINENIINVDKEREPIKFLEKIFDYINSELNGLDKEINNDLIKLTEQYNNIPKFLSYYNNHFLKAYNSIIGKKFYGIFQKKYLCDACGEKIKYRKFNYIKLDKKLYSNYFIEKNLDNSFTDFYLEDLIEFNFKNENNKEKCVTCQKEVEVETKIIRFPDIIIFSIKWEDFDSEKGFKSENIWLDDNKLIFDEIIDLKNYSCFNNTGKKEYKIRSVISYGIINQDNENNKIWKKFITFNRNIIDNNFYSCQPSASIYEIKTINRREFVPSVLFYESLK